MAALMKFDTLSWAKKLEKAGVPAQQAALQVALVFQAVDDNTCTKQDLRESEGRIEVNTKDVESKLALKIKDVESRLVLEIEALRRELVLAIEEVKGSINTQIAKWVLGVSVVQTTVLAVLIRSIH